MEIADVPATNQTEVEHAYHASGHTNGKMIWVVLVNLLADAFIAIAAPIVYMLIIVLVLMAGLSLCNVCGLLIIILPLALAIPWGLGYGVGYLVNIINVGMQKTTRNNNQGYRWFFMVFTIIGIIAVFTLIWINGTVFKDLDVAGWVMITVVIYGAVAMAIAMLVVGQAEPLPPFCEPCLEYMEKMKLPPQPINDIELCTQALHQRQFFSVMKNEMEPIPSPETNGIGETAASTVPSVPSMKKELVLVFYHCKDCAQDGVLEATYQTETTKMEKNKEKKETTSRMVFSTLLTPEEVQALTPIAQAKMTVNRK